MKPFNKVILSQKKSNFPYINIYEDKIENNLTATFLKQDEKTKVKEHFKALFNSAEALYIYDKYLNNNQDSFKKFAQECFPKRELSIFYPPSLPLTQNLCTNLKSICKDWQIKQNLDNVINNDYNELHDRYIIVDKKIQIILTSGIDNLMGIEFAKDFTYIIRLI